MSICTTYILFLESISRQVKFSEICSNKGFTHLNKRLQYFSQGKDLSDASDANDANHKQIKQDDQSSSMYMLRCVLGYAFNKQSQKYLEIKACKTLRTRYEYSMYHKRIYVLRS